MVHLLHIDTSTDTSIVAISGDGDILASKSNNETRNHAATINLMIDDLLKEAGLSLENLDGIGVCAGPGSYTGLRIGMATAKGLCYVLDKPLFLHNKLTLLAYNSWLENQNSDSNFASLLTARDKEYFLTIFNSKFEPIKESQHVVHDELKDLFIGAKNTFIVTDISFDINNELQTSNLQIDANTKISLKAWGIFAIDEYKCNKNVILSSSEPFYLKQVYAHK